MLNTASFSSGAHIWLISGIFVITMATMGIGTTSDKIGIIEGDPTNTHHMIPTHPFAVDQSVIIEQAEEQAALGQ